MANPTTNLSVTLPVVGGSSDAWGTILNNAFQSYDDVFSSSGTPVSLVAVGGTIDNMVIGGTTSAAATFTSVVIGANAASAGGLRFANNTAINFRNSANSSDSQALIVNGSDILQLGVDTDIAGISIGTTAVNTTIGADLVITGALDHNGSTVGLYNKTPVSQASPPDPLALTGTYSTDYTDIQATVNAIRTALVNIGIFS